MFRPVLLAIFILVAPALANAGPKEESQAVFDRFLTAITATDIDSVAATFWPDAQFWGTTKRDLITEPEGVRAYFKAAMDSMKGSGLKATSRGTSVLVLSDSVVFIAGRWEIERVVDGKPTIVPLRVSMAVTKRGDTWGIAQFHNSLRPGQ